MTEREEIEQQFRANLERVTGLVGLYEEVAARGRGRKAVPDSDLLRAAVILLHATLEDLLRSLAEWKLPTASATSLERITFGGAKKGKEQFTLVDLAEFRGQSVDEVIARSVAGYLERSNYNHPGDVADLLRKIGVDYSMSKEMRDDLAIMMIRRHAIAHRADRNPLQGPGHQIARSISVALVKQWTKRVEGFGLAVLKKS
jgi:hypothetical protein